jgi:hypothetical protein
MFSLQVTYKYLIALLFREELLANNWLAEKIAISKKIGKYNQVKF